jgi:hypothetical protein
MTGGLEKEGEGHSGPIRSGTGRAAASRSDQHDSDQERAQGATVQDRADGTEPDENERKGYEDHGNSRDEDGTHGESSGSRPDDRYYDRGPTQEVD